MLPRYGGRGAVTYPLVWSSAMVTISRFRLQAAVSLATLVVVVIGVSFPALGQAPAAPTGAWKAARLKAALTQAEPDTVPAAPPASPGEVADDNPARRDPYYGLKVYWKDDAVAKVGKTTVDVEKLAWPASVGDVQGEWLWLGRAWVRKRDVRTLEENLDFWVEEVRRKPSSARAWLARANCWRGRGELANAIKDYDEAIRLDPKSAYAFCNRGFLRATCPDESFRDPAAAMRDANKAVSLDTKNGYSHSAKACALAANGDFAGATAAQK